MSLTLVLLRFSIEDTTGTYFFVDNGDRLESVRQNDVGVHSSYVDMINQWLRLDVGTLCLESAKLIDDLRFDLIKVCNIFERGLALNLDGKLHNILCLFDESLVTFLFKLEVDRDVRSKHSLLQTFYSTTGVGIIINQLVVVESLELRNLLIWEYNVTSESLSHQKILTKCTRATS
jgi:hypothetical protein